MGALPLPANELAARMQLAGPEALDISSEPPEVLRLYGLDHSTRLTVRHDGIDRRLTDVHGRVIHEILV